MNLADVNRLHQILLIVATLAASWLGMQLVHEVGHVIGAWFIGAEVVRVVLWPLSISRTDIAHNSHPLIVVWFGPIFGSLVPLILWAIAVAARSPVAFLLRFFSGFCLIANGLYIGLGSFNRIGDCGVMLQNGSEIWQLWLFGAIAVPIGFYLWHGEGLHFGFSTASGKVSRVATYVALTAFFGLLSLAILVDGN
jgi:hypothetical protein